MLQMVAEASKPTKPSNNCRAARSRTCHVHNAMTTLPNTHFTAPLSIYKQKKRRQKRIPKSVTTLFGLVRRSTKTPPRYLRIVHHAPLHCPGNTARFSKVLQVTEADDEIVCVMHLQIERCEDNAMPILVNSQDVVLHSRHRQGTQNSVRATRILASNTTKRFCQQVVIENESTKRHNKGPDPKTYQLTVCRRRAMGAIKEYQRAQRLQQTKAV